MVDSRTTTFSGESVTIVGVDSTSSSSAGGAVTIAVLGSSSAGVRNEWVCAGRVSREATV